MSNKKLMLIDGNSIINRAFYAIQGKSLLATADGLYTNAVLGFLNILFKYMDEEKPDFIAVAFDLKSPTFRHKEYAEYKAMRKGMPPELAVQLPVVKDILDAMRIKRLEMEGFEADDIIGSVSLCAEQAGLEAVIITGDRDALQLAGNTVRIKVPTTRGGRTETDEYDADTVQQKYGVSPKQLIDVKGLMGDKSDNISGVPGIGEKTALELISKFGSIENLYSSLDQIDKKGLRDRLESGKELAFMSRRLATIERNMPFLCEIEELKRQEFDNERLYELFRRLEFKSYIDKLDLKKSTPISVQVKKAACISTASEFCNIKKSIIEAGEVAVFYMVDRSESSEYVLDGITFAWGEKNIAHFDMEGTLCEGDFIQEFKEIFENPQIKKYGHDMKRFIVYLKQKGIRFENLFFDTMIAAYILNPSRETYTVSDLSQEYIGRSIEIIQQFSAKGKTGGLKHSDTQTITEAAGMNADAILSLVPVLESLLCQNQQEQLYREIELPLVEVLADMEYCGFKVNTDVLKSFSKRLESDLERLTSAIYLLAGEEFNINSPKQLGVILFDKLKLPVIKRTKTGYSTDAEVLEQLSDKHELIGWILEYRQVAKLKSTYVEGLLSVISPYSGRIHSSFNQTVAVTGRISSTEPNLQNIPVKLELGREIRKAFIPENKEYVLCDADYSQIELRVLAHITKDASLIEAFANNEDIHTNTAAKVFGVSKAEVTPLMRSRAKAVNFGIVYGIGDFSLSRDLGITRKEAKRYIEEYLDKYPGVRKYMHDIVEQGKSEGYVKTLFNRRRYLPELKSSNFNIRSFGERIAMNTPIQGSAADIIKIAMVKVYNELKKRGMKSRLVLQIHDELLVETHKSEEAQVKTIMRECMENAASLDVPLTVEVKSGDTWYETK